MTGCGSGSIASSTNSDPTSAAISLSSASSAVLGGQSLKLNAAVAGGESSDYIDWTVNGIIGGTAATGAISKEGVYTAPNALNAVVNLGAQLHQNDSIRSSIPISVITPQAAKGQISFSFVLPDTGHTSAAIYDSNLHLVKTLWSNQIFSPGPHQATWDGTNDQGIHVNNDQYRLKLLYSNVLYDWGVIGNTSTSLAGPDNWDAQGSFPMDAAIANNMVFTANGYAEGRPNASIFSMDAPQSPRALTSLGQAVELNFVATDGDIIYFGNVGNGWAGSVAFVFAYDVNGGHTYNFPNGSKVSTAPNEQISVIDLAASASSLTGPKRLHLPTGLAVQKNGRLLAISHGSYTMRDTGTESMGEDRISLFDKKTGASAGTISISDPQRIAFARNGDLWVISGKNLVRISSVGSMNNIVATISGISKPLAVAVDPITDDLLIADGDNSQQVKRYSTNGVFISSYGKLGGYTDCDPSVTVDRLYLDASAGPGTGNGQIPGTWLAVGNDSSFWVGDLGNNRALHIDSAGQYIDQFSFLRMLYSVTVDHNDPSRVFADLLEFKIDYTKDLIPGNPDPARGGNGSWALVRNWSACIPNGYDLKFARVNTWPNGKTYAELFNEGSKSKISGGPQLELIELPESGPLRLSGMILADGGFNEYIDDDGDLSYWKGTQTLIPTSTMTAYKRSFLSIGESGFPTWTAPAMIASVTINGTPTDTNDPFGYGGWGMATFPKGTQNGYVVTYKTSVSGDNSSFHIGGVPLGASDWSWKASKGRPISVPDDMGTFPEIDSYGGHNGIVALVEGSNILQGYDGQYGTFSSQWMHWLDDGLLVGQFGHPANGDAPNGSLFPGAAGNIATMSTANVDGKIYLYTSDESYHAGIHRWEISALDSIKEQSAIVTLGQTAALIIP